MLKRLVIFLILIAVLWGIVYALRPLSVELSLSPDREFARLEVSYGDWFGVSIVSDSKYANILLLDPKEDDQGRYELILRKYYVRFFPPAISPTPLVCVKNMGDEVVGPGELLVTAETYDGQPFCDYVFEFQRLGDLCILEATCERELGKKYTISNLDFGGNTSVIQWDEAGVYAITFRSADGEVLCSYNLVYQPELGGVAGCYVPARCVETTGCLGEDR